jgi:hypothetical protein
LIDQAAQEGHVRTDLLKEKNTIEISYIYNTKKERLGIIRVRQHKTNINDGNDQAAQEGHAGTELIKEKKYN